MLHGQRGLTQVNANGELIHPPVKGYGKGKNAKQNAVAAAAAAAAAGGNTNFLSANDMNSEPTLALFALACPFGPPSLFELPQRDALFKTKHKTNLAPISIDAK